MTAGVSGYGYRLRVPQASSLAVPAADAWHSKAFRNHTIALAPKDLAVMVPRALNQSYCVASSFASSSERATSPRASAARWREPGIRNRWCRMERNSRSHELVPQSRLWLSRLIGVPRMPRS